MSEEMVTLTIDGKEISVPKGTNLIEACKLAGVEVPYYCYHPHLSVPGNCRMCQLEVVGAPKLMIGCHTQAQNEMEVKTQLSSEAVKAAQESTLEMILINHPLDCTVCDQAGHCKLQDYHFRFNGKPSRFLEEKVKKVKAEPLGPTVMLDGERCIMCTRCIRFCDEVTGTSEIGMINRGDRSCITVDESQPLDNPLSGTVVDLCPVGALTHKEWRFNTRIWYTKETESVCTGCSTGCNVKVAVRDQQVVHVKGRENAAVNKEWLCDEGRYGFNRFLPTERVKTSDTALKDAAFLKGSSATVFVAPDLMTEEYVILKRFLDASLPDAKVVLAYRERELTDVEKILISPDYAANYRGAEFAGLVSGDLEKDYLAAYEELRAGKLETVLVVGDRAFASQDIDVTLTSALSNCKGVGILTDAASELAVALSVNFGARSILEKSGLLVNRQGRLQYSAAVIDYPGGTESTWAIINSLANSFGKSATDAADDRGLTIECLKSDERLSEFSIKSLKQSGGAQVL